MSQYLQQGTLNFTSGYKLQTQWGLTEAGVFTLETAGALMVAMGAHWGAPRAAFVIGLVMVLTAIVLLFLHLGHPVRAWRAMINVRTSWISRGTLALGAFAICGLWYLWLSWTGLEMDRSGGLQSFLQWVFVALALFIGLYPGLILSASPAISFWSSGLLPVLSLLQGAATAALLLLAFRAGAGAAMNAAILWSAIWLHVALAVALALYLAGMLRRGAAAAESARYLLQGQRGEFMGIACAAGIALPLLLMLVAAGSGGAAAALAIAAVARLVGDVALRHAFLKVGMFQPVI